MKNLSLLLSRLSSLAALTALSPIMATAGEDDSFNLFSYNIRHSTEKDADQNWQYRRHHVTSLLKFHQADIVGTQEARKHQVEDIVAATGFDYSGVGKVDAKTKGVYTAIFFDPERFSRLDEGHFWLSETPDKPSIGWDARTERLCCWVQLEDSTTGSAFYVFNVHMDHQAETARREGAQLMKKRIEQIAGDAPVIVTGDMNADPASEPIGIYRTFLHDARELSEAEPYGPVGTFNGFDYHRKLDRRIDYIFLSDAFDVLRYGALTDTYSQRFPSDHLPVLAEVGLKPLSERDPE